jgi:hypothetical protein
MSLTTADMDRAVERWGEAAKGSFRRSPAPALRAVPQHYAQTLTRDGKPHGDAVARYALVVVSGDAEPSGHAATCTREGRRWRIRLGSRSVLVDHRVGMLHLAVLLANPSTEIPSIELAAGATALGNRNAHTGQSVQPTLDHTAIQQYRHRLSQLRTEIDEIESSDQRGRAARANAEREWLMAQLAAATGLGGRARHFPDNRERARLAVGRAIRRAITRIHQADPLVAKHLCDTIHTGMRCSYHPA